jgi:hypothetical protein
MSVEYIGLRCAHYANTLAEFEMYVKDREKSKWYHTPIKYKDLTGKDLNTIDKIIKFKTRFKTIDGTIRRENDSFVFYSDDLKFLKEIFKIDNLSPKLYKVELMPTGIKYFAKDPPSTFRLYLTNGKIDLETKRDILEYINRTPDLEPSNRLYDWLHRESSRYNYTYLWDNYFINYNDSSNYTMMALKFPEIIGKNYKLEKKPK